MSDMDKNWPYPHLESLPPAVAQILLDLAYALKDTNGNVYAKGDTLDLEFDYQLAGEVPQVQGNHAYRVMNSLGWIGLYDPTTCKVWRREGRNSFRFDDDYGRWTKRVLDTRGKNVYLVDLREEA